MLGDDKIPSKGFKIAGGFLILFLAILLAQFIKDWVRFGKMTYFAYYVATSADQLTAEALNARFGGSSESVRIEFGLAVYSWLLLALWAYYAQKVINHLRSGSLKRSGWSFHPAVMVIPFIGQILSVPLLSEIWRETRLEKYLHKGGLPVPKRHPLLVLSWALFYLVHFLSGRFGSWILQGMEMSARKAIVAFALMVLNMGALCLSLIILAAIVIIVWNRLAVLYGVGQFVKDED